MTLELFHTPAYIDLVRERSAAGGGYLDGGDTPAYRGRVRGRRLRGRRPALRPRTAIMAGARRRAFVPIAGLHHAARDRAAGFCVFNDCGVVIEPLRRAPRAAAHRLRRHRRAPWRRRLLRLRGRSGADLRRHPRETAAASIPAPAPARRPAGHRALGTKLNIPLPPGAGDAEFADAWERVMLHVGELRAPSSSCCSAAPTASPATRSPTCSSAAARMRARPRELVRLADRLGHGRVLALGGGGYNRAQSGPGLDAMWWRP